MGICDDRVVIVTGAGGGLGRAHALAFAAEGAAVVVNDIGTSREGEGSSARPAQSVVDEIRSAGGSAVANTDDIADWDGAESLVRTAIEEFGTLDVLVNNAGFLR
ncbi:MAG TPA: SDR family NAD(P)-dependent oxidoreductase, partial [Mycobacteriales bacterium]|nr:SDR family NAD(P)-dependent oxidoreductase [Mycobacteriales bacterium]